MRILYVGLPIGAVWLDRHGYRPVGVALGHRGMPGERRVRRWKEEGTTLAWIRPDLEREEMTGAARALAPDLLLSFFWPRRIPTTILEIPRLGAFGTHPSLLPRWRGPDPYYWAIREGDEVTGVTLHRLSGEYDTGAIVAQRRLRITEEDDAHRLARRLDRPALALLVECAERAAEGRPLEGRPQAKVGASWAREPTDDDLALDFGRDAEALCRAVRAAAPAPGASVSLGERVVLLSRATVYAGSPPRALHPAEAFLTDEGAAAVVCGDGRALVLREAVDEEGRTVDPATLLGLS